MRQFKSEAERVTENKWKCPDCGQELIASSYAIKIHINNQCPKRKQKR